MEVNPAREEEKERLRKNGHKERCLVSPKTRQHFLEEVVSMMNAAKRPNKITDKWSLDLAGWKLLLTLTRSVHWHERVRKEKVKEQSTNYHWWTRFFEY